MKSEHSRLDWLKERVRTGPPPMGEGGTLAWMVGMLVWWRMMAIQLTLMVGLAVSILLLKYTSAPMAVILSFLVGTFVGERVIKLSPKYEVTKNY